MLVGDPAHVVPSFLAQGQRSRRLVQDLLASGINQAPQWQLMMQNRWQNFCQPSHARNSIPKAIRAFEDTRTCRNIKVQELSLHNSRCYHLGEEDQAEVHVDVRAANVQKS